MVNHYMINHDFVRTDMDMTYGCKTWHLIVQIRYLQCDAA